MRFLVDECSGPSVASWLHDQGHEIFSVFEEARGMSDSDILEKALTENWILITNDRDFGEIVFRERRQHRGIVFLRVSDERSAVKIDVIRRLLAKYSEKLENRFVIVSETRVRFAAL